MLYHVSVRARRRGIFGPTNTQLSAKYQTLVTPAGWAFAIWGPIFIWEGIFAIVQMLPRFRSNPIIQDGIAYWWVARVAGLRLNAARLLNLRKS